MKTADIARAVNYELPNTYTTLQALARHGICELVPGKDRQHWRLAGRFRPTAQTYRRIASLVRRGEWTTYGDISIAAQGTSQAARAVGRLAAIGPFPNPHRVLNQGGVINPGWVDANGNGPDECKRLLEEEGIEFDDDDQADPAHYVSAEVLRKRDEHREAG